MIVEMKEQQKNATTHMKNGTNPLSRSAIFVKSKQRIDAREYLRCTAHPPWLLSGYKCKHIFKIYFNGV